MCVPVFWSGWLTGPCACTHSFVLAITQVRPRHHAVCVNASIQASIGKDELSAGHGIQLHTLLSRQQQPGQQQ